MITQNGFHGNSNGTGRLLDCPSDYPVIDVTPAMPRPKWRDQHPLFCHHIDWVDSEGISHGLTLRSDDLQGLMADLRLVKAAIRQAKQKAAEHAPQQATEPDSDVPPCKIHGTPMQRRQSKRTQGIYFSHKMANGELCFGREKKA